VSELQYCGARARGAKQATENTTLTMLQRFERQLAFVEPSLDAPGRAVGGMRFPGVRGRPQGAVADGQFAIIGPVALFRARAARPGSRSRSRLRQADHPSARGRAAGRPRGARADGEGFLPLDPSRGGALKALVEKSNIVHIFKKGGPIMWPLLGRVRLALATVFERVFFLILES
jgi:hypothetical protein